MFDSEWLGNCLYVCVMCAMDANVCRVCAVWWGAVPDRVNAKSCLRRTCVPVCKAGALVVPRRYSGLAVAREVAVVCECG